MRKLGWMVVAIALMGAVPIAAGSTTGAATASASALDCTNWRYGAADEPASLPTEFDRNGYKRTSLRDPALATSPHNLCGQKGAAVDLAWGITQGRPDVRIAVLDSGIKWRDAGAMRDLANRAYLNRGEVTPPCATPSGDCNNDGRFSIADFGAIPDLNGNGLAGSRRPHPQPRVLERRRRRPQRLRRRHLRLGLPLRRQQSRSTPSTTATAPVRPRTRPRRTTASATSGPARAARSFRCASATRSSPTPAASRPACCSGSTSHAAVVQEALGAITNPRQAQQAIDSAYRRGVPIIASMADEASKHPNLPGSLEHTLTVNSVRDTGSPKSYLALNGCTNFGGRTFLSIPSSSCSSEATGIMSGVAGLLVSEARDRGLTLSTNEILQLARSSADDIDFSTPNAVDPANDFLSGATVRYPSTAGWDATHGYGRLNAYELVKRVRDAQIPPEADLTSPKWFSVLPATGSHRDQGSRGCAARARLLLSSGVGRGAAAARLPGVGFVERRRWRHPPQESEGRHPRVARSRDRCGRARWRNGSARRSPERPQQRGEVQRSAPRGRDRARWSHRGSARRIAEAGVRAQRSGSRRRDAPARGRIRDFEPGVRRPRTGRRPGVGAPPTTVASTRTAPT